MANRPPRPWRTIRPSTRALACLSLLLLGTIPGPAVSARPHRQDAPSISQVYLPIALSTAPIAQPYFDRPSLPADALCVAGGPAQAVALRGHVAFVALGVHVVALDTSGEGEPRVLGASPPLPGEVMDIVLQDHLAYVAVDQLVPLEDEHGGLFTLDIHDPTEIRVIGHALLPNAAPFGQTRRGGGRLAVADGQVFVLSLHKKPESYYRETGYNGLSVIDIAMPALPRLQSSTHTTATDLAVVGGHLFLCDGQLLRSTMGLPLEVEAVDPPIDCASIAAIDHERGLAVMDDLGEELRTWAVDPSGELRGEQRLDVGTSVESQAWWQPTRMVSGPNLLWAVGIEHSGGGTIVGVRAQQDRPLEVVTVSHMPIAPLGVAADGDHVFVAGIADDRLPREVDINDLIGIFGPDFWPQAAGRVLVYDWPRLGALKLGKQIDGVGAPVHPFLVTPSMSLGLEIGPRFKYDQITLMRSDGGLATPHWKGRWPLALGEAPVDARDFLGGAAVTDHGVYVRGREGVVAYSLRESPDTTGELLPLHGRLASQGEFLFVLSPSGTLEVLDTSIPRSPTTLASLPLPPADEQRAHMADDGLWLLAKADGTTTIRRIDVRNPKAPILGEALVIDTAWLDFDRMALHSVTDGLLIVAEGNTGLAWHRIRIESMGGLSQASHAADRVPSNAYAQPSFSTLAGDSLLLPLIVDDHPRQVLRVPWRDSAAPASILDLPAALRSRESDLATVDGRLALASRMERDSLLLSGIAGFSGWVAFER